MYKRRSLVNVQRKGHQIDMIHLTNDALSRSIKDISSDVESTVVQRVRICPYGALQLDESTDVSDRYVLSVFARYTDEDTGQEEILFCRSFKERTSGRDVCNLPSFNGAKIDRSLFAVASVLMKSHQ
jgi:hypothetical protein